MNISLVLSVWLIRQLLLAGLVYGDRGTFTRQSDDEFQMLIAGGYIPDDVKLVKNLVSIRTLNFIEYYGDNHFCTGVILSVRIILTAAQCVTEHRAIMNPHGILIVFGSIYRLSAYEKEDCRRVNRIVVHPNYKRYVNFDVAVLRLLDSIPNNARYVRPINKRKQVLVHEGMNCITLGWGQVYPHGPYGNEIMFLDVVVRSSEFCKDMENFDAEGTICVEPNYDGQVCPGDMGGSLMCQDHLAGIIGGGEKNCEGIKAMKFVNYSYIENWIDETVESLSCGNNNWLSTLPIVLLVLTVVKQGNFH